MSEIPQLSDEDVKFLQSLSDEMDQQFELAEPTHKDLLERLGFLNQYFGVERRRMIASYLDDRTDAFRCADLSEQDEHVRALFENTVDMIFKLDEPLYINVDNIPVGREVMLISLFHRADTSQNDMNIYETDLPLRFHIRDLREAIMDIMQYPDSVKPTKINQFFDKHIWSTVQRFLEFGEGQE